MVVLVVIVVEEDTINHDNNSLRLGIATYTYLNGSKTVFYAFKVNQFINLL